MPQQLQLRHTTVATMPPRSFQLEDEALASDQNETNSFVQLGFSSGLLESIRAGKGKIKAWVENEKQKAEAVAASYRQCLQDQKDDIRRRTEEIRKIQIERGLSFKKSQDDGEQGKDKGRNGEDDNLAARKQAMEQQKAEIQLEIMKLQTQRNNREERVKGMFK